MPLAADFLTAMEQFVRLANLFFDRMLQLHGLSSTEVKLLLFLSCHPDCGLARDVVRLRTLSKASVSRAVESLRQKGYLACRPDESDRRSVHLALTPLAQEKVEAALRLQQEILDTLVQGVSAEEYRTTVRIMTQMYANGAKLLETPGAPLSSSEAGPTAGKVR